MELTRLQEQGLKIAVERYKNHEAYTVVAGYAGTGKSTLIQYIISALELWPTQVAYIAYTGKAAQVLRKKGCGGAMTAHRLLYKSVPQRDGTFRHIPKDYIGDYKLVVVDEVSMLPAQMWNLLMTHGIHVIACGDPGQLPPIGEENGILEHPHIFLDEIMRQEEGSEIIRLSADIRAGKPLQPYRGQEINIVRRKDMVDGMLMWADQVLCGKNATRYALNDCVRRMKWGEEIETSTPLVGDKIICLRNDWDKITQAGDALVNGTIGTLSEIRLCKDDYILDKEFRLDFTPEDMEDDGLIDVSFRNLLVDWKLLTTHEPTITKENYRSFPRWLHLNQFDYGYVVTCHKAQGSEYERVLVIEEMLKNTDHARWLYTAVTRASSKLTLVMKD